MSIFASPAAYVQQMVGGYLGPFFGCTTDPAPAPENAPGVPPSPAIPTADPNALKLVHKAVDAVETTWDGTCFLCSRAVDGDPVEILLGRYCAPCGARETAARAATDAAVGRIFRLAA